MSKHHNGEYYAREAERHGLRVEHGKGSHIKIYGDADRGYIIVPKHRELANGTEYAIKKWFIKLGIVVTLVLALWYIF